MQKLAEKFSRRRNQLAFGIEKLVDAAEIRLGLLHHGHIQKYHRLAQMLIRPEPPIAPGEQLTMAPGLPAQTLLP